MRFFAVGFLLLACCASFAEPRKIVILAGKKSHGPEGNGIHDYGWSARLLQCMLRNSNVKDHVEVVVHLDGWPADTSSFESADTIMIISDGRDGNIFEEALHLVSAEKIELITRQVKRGCGLVTFHFSTFAPDRYADLIFDWTGGYFDWETDGKRQWYSSIEVKDTQTELAAPSHVVSRGVQPFQLREEFYFNLRFPEGLKGVSPILRVPALPGRDDTGCVVAWTRERANGGRAFSTTCGHFYDNWKNDDFRKLVLNGLVWSARVDVPVGGVIAPYVPREVIANAELSSAVLKDQSSIRTLLVAGNEAHDWHNWKKTTPAIKSLLEMDERVSVDVTTDIEDLGRRDLTKYQAIVLNYCNWQDPKPLSNLARQAFSLFVSRGGGLLVIHFANGAFHPSLPSAEASDWPEYRRIVRRVWDHQGKGESQSGHDAFGLFRVEIDEHALTKGMSAFDVTDELYFRQAGSEAVEMALSAKSNVTGKREPLAFTYRYGDGRVFQTFLGHSEKTYEAFEAREILRRALAWSAGRSWPERTSDEFVVPKSAEAKTRSAVEGKFGKSLDAREFRAKGAAIAEGRDRPITIECWAKLDGKGSFNILIAHETKGSTGHWELFTGAGSGHVTLYAAGSEPDHVRTTTDIADGNWHFVSLVLAEDRAAIHVDGKLAAESAIIWSKGTGDVQEFAVGGLLEGGLGCDGQIDEVRISRGIVRSDVPTSPMKVEETTIALWRFDETDASGKYIDETKAKRKLSVDANVTPIASANSSKEDHFGEESVGFKWQEGDSADGRWNDAEVGPFLASTVTTPAGVVAKGLSIKDGKNTVLFDTERCMVRAAWSDGFLKFDSTRHGLISSPTIGGRLAFAIAPASVRQMPRFRSIQKTPTEVIVEYAMGKVIVRESFRAEMDKESLCVQRHIRQIGNESVTLPIASAGAGESIEMITPREAELRRADGSRLAFSCRGGNFHLDEKNLVWKSEVGEGSGSVDYGPRHLWMERWFKGTREPPDVVTRVKRSTLASGLVVDDLPLPVKNPFRSLCFASGHDFFSNGDVAVSMVHGDVWIATGVNEELQELRWRRFATGLFQPLGVKIVDDVVYVIGRDQITRLVDEDKDGEADLYECVTNQYETSPGGHDYVACLETDSAGRFHFVHATMGLVRVDPATRRCDPIATGFRNPNGLAIGPGDVITVSPQEGTWTPTSAIAQIKTGAYYGFPSERDAKLDRPVEPPLCWIPRLMDNSSGGQVWAMGKHLGPLNGQLLHTTFGQCRLMLVVRDRDGRQGGVVPLPLEFRSGLMRGRVSPRDGHLYVSGLKGWVSAAVDDGCLCRVRCAGGPVGLPIAMKTTRQGLDLTFTEPIDRSIAEDPDRYVVERWNYRRTSAYGSAEYSVADPLRVGRDPVDVPSATLLADERTVHLEIPDLAPVMQISVACDLVTKEGFAFQRTLSATIHEVSSREVDYPLARRVRPGQLPEEVVKRLQTGLVASLVQGDRRDWLVTRQLAMTVPTSTSATHGVGPEPFTCQWNGFLQVPMAGEYRFGIEGTGQATLFVNDRQVKEERVQLHRGYNRIRAQWLSSSGGEQRLRVLWRSERFAEEPIPATSLCHDSKNDELAQAEKVRRGEQVWRERQCGACHDGEPTLSSPALVGLGSRFTNDWLARWLIDPSSVRPGHEMPLMFSKDNNHDRQMVADLMSFLMKEDGGSLPASEWTDEDVRAGSLRYEQLACLACHHFEDNGPSDEYGRISLASVGSKFRAGKLAEFLKRPSEHHPSTRMPDFSLTDADAKSLAAYVASRGKKQAHEELLVGDPDRGLNVFLVKGCGNCHKLGIGSTERHPVKSITSVKEVDHGCLRRVRVDSSIPWFEMTDADRSAVSAYLESVRYKARATEGEKLLVEETRYLVDRYRCFACHSRDGKTSPRGLLLQEESESGLPVETLPDLTWAGEKLRMGWVRSLLSGKEKPSRPWLTARMPTFPNAEALSAGLAAEHGLSLDEEESIAVDPALAKLGRELVGLKTGLDCRQCHAMGSEEPIGDDRTQIALGINFATVRDRMRHEHYGRFVLDPPRFDIGTRMPRLVTDGRSTRVTSILGGDASKQFEAIWHYIHSLPRKNIAGTR